MYDHTQKAPLGLCILVVGLAFATVGALLISDPVGRWALGGFGLLLILLSLCFWRLTVVDRGPWLSVRFGPVPLFGTRLRYDEMLVAEPARSDLVDGWGVHYLSDRGWIFNLWGYQCVRIRMTRRTVRVGTDDVAGLVAFLRSKRAAVPANAGTPGTGLPIQAEPDSAASVRPDNAHVQASRTAGS